MTKVFKKPGKAKTRFPPVIDPFSRTLAAPISSQRHYFSICHRIGTSFTPTSKGFYIDSETRMIRYKDINQSETKLNIVAENAIEPATEQEEYDGLMNPALVDPAKIDARKNSYV